MEEGVGLQCQKAEVNVKERSKVNKHARVQTKEQAERSRVQSKEQASRKVQPRGFVASSKQFCLFLFVD